MSDTKKKPARRHTEETKRKISLAKTGKPRLFSRNPDETRRKMSAAKKGNQYARGRRHTAEAREKIRAGLKAFYARLKAGEPDDE